MLLGDSVLPADPHDRLLAKAPPAGTTAERSSPTPGTSLRGRHLARRIATALLLVGVAGAGWYGWHTAHRPSVTQQESFHWKEVRQALDRHDYTRAVEMLSARLHARPLDAQVHFFLSRAYRGLKDYDASTAQLKRAAELHWPGDAVRLEFALQAAQVGDLATVERPLAEHVRRYPADNALVCEALAEGFLTTHRYGELWQLATAWQKEQPDDWLPALFRGHAQYLAGFPEKAIPEYEKALHLASNPSLVQIWLAGASMDAGRYRQALDMYQRYLAHHIDDADALFGVANCEASLGNEDKERAALANVLRHDPNRVSALLLQGKLELDSGQAAKALGWLDRADKLAPASTDILQSKLRALRDLGREHEAEICRHKIQELTQQFTEIDRLRKRLRQESGNVGLRYRIAELYRRMGRPQDAVQWYRSVLSLDPNHTDSRRALAACETNGVTTPHQRPSTPRTAGGRTNR